MRIRLSRSQQQLWFAASLCAHPSGYLVSMVLEIKGPVVDEALISAFSDIVDRHEILRTRFFEEEGNLCGEVMPASQFGLEFESYSRVEVREYGGVNAVLGAEVEAPMDISRGIPIRAKLIRTTTGDQFLCVVVHHLAFDDWSRNQFYAELNERYRAHVTGLSSAQAPLPAQYHEYAVGRDERDARGSKESMEYWREILQDMEPFEIASDRTRPPRRQGRGAGTGFVIDADLAEAISRIGRAQGATTAMVLFAAAQVTLYRFTGRHDVSFGTSIAQRDEDESQELIGPLLNMLVLRGDMSGNPAFTELLDRFADTLLGAMEHSDVPFNELVAEFGSTTDRSRTPLHQIVVQYGSGARRRPELEGCEVAELTMPATGSKYDLAILFDQRDDGSIIADIGWDRDLYEPETINSLADSLRTVIDDIALTPDKRLSEIRTLSPQAEAELLTLESGQVVEPANMSLGELMEYQARTRPESTAVVADEGKPCTYGELDAMANRVALLLRESGVGLESIVAVHAPRSVGQVAAILGVLKAGAAYLALDPHYPVERIRFMLENSRTPVMLFEGDPPPDLRRIPAVCVDIGNVRAWDREVGSPPVRHIDQDASCALIYTSGSTGRPKGVTLTHRGIAGRLADIQSVSPLEPSDRVLLNTSCAFDVSITELFWPLVFGATVVLSRPGGHRDPGYLVNRMAQAQVTVASFVPSVLSLMVRERKMSDCVNLRMVTAGGEELHRTLVEQVRGRLPGCEVYNGYGPTEASVYGSVRRCDADVSDAPMAEPLGGPLPNTQKYVLDEWMNLVPPGGVGELCLGGLGVARGYLGLAGLTAERFVPDPFAVGKRLYRTGDAVRYSKVTRTYEFLGRSDFQVKIGGVRVELGEVETVLGSHEAVVECAVVVSDAGDGGWKMSAFVRLLSTAWSPNDLLAHARKWLPSTAVPRYVTVVDAIPTLPNGKVDRQRLVELDNTALEPIEPEVFLTGHQKVLADIWCEVLGSAGVTTVSDFFAIGGQSLSAIRMTNRVSEWLDLDVPVSLVFDVPIFKDFYHRLVELMEDPF